MPTSPPSLIIPLVNSELPTCNPNLMPFHIDYSGPAAVSAFMRVEKAAEDVLTSTDDVSKRSVSDAGLMEPSGSEKSSAGAEAKAGPAVAAQATLLDITATSMQASLPTTSSNESVKSESLTISVTSGSEVTLVNDSQISDTATAASSPPLLDDADKRFISTFRGRTIHGLTIDLPSGYGGLVLQSEEENLNSISTKDSPPKAGKGKAPEKEIARPRGRLTRSAVSKRPEVINVEDEDVEMAAPVPPSEATIDQSAAAAAPDNHPIRNLIPKSQFSSFTLWHADRPVDKGSDEYYRTLTEWVSLAHEIHRTDL